MEATWLKLYPPGIPPEVDVHVFASLTDMLLHTCGRFGDRPACSNMGVSMTYEELDRASRDFAAYLQGTLGLRKGERVAIMMPNLLQYPVALFGVLRAGLVVVNVNPQYTVPELEHQLKDSGASAIVVLENFAHTLQEVLERNPTLHLAVITTEVGDMLPVARELLTNVVVKYVKHMVPALTEQALLEHCRQHLTGYKMPKIVEFRSEPLPKSNIGKILRRELRHAAGTARARTSPSASAGSTGELRA